MGGYTRCCYENLASWELDNWPVRDRIQHLSNESEGLGWVKQVMKNLEGEVKQLLCLVQQKTQNQWRDTNETGRKQINKKQK